MSHTRHASPRMDSGPKSSSGTEKRVSRRSKYAPPTSELRRRDSSDLAVPGAHVYVPRQCMWQSHLRSAGTGAGSMLAQLNRAGLALTDVRCQTEHGARLKASGDLQPEYVIGRHAWVCGLQIEVWQCSQPPDMTCFWHYAVHFECTRACVQCVLSYPRDAVDYSMGTQNVVTGRSSTHQEDQEAADARRTVQPAAEGAPAEVRVTHAHNTLSTSCWPSQSSRAANPFRTSQLSPAMSASAQIYVAGKAGHARGWGCVMV